MRPGEDPDDVIARANAAMYAAKRDGGSTVRFEAAGTESPLERD